MKTATGRLNTKANPLVAAGLGFLLCGLATRTDAQTPTLPATPNAAPAAKKEAVLPVPPQIDKQAMALLRHNQQAMFALKTYEVECRTTRTRSKVRPGFPHVEYEIATIAAQKPNKMRYDKWDLKQDNQPTADWTKPVQQPADAVYRCDGTTFYQQVGNMYRASKMVAPKYIRSIVEP